MVRGREAAGGQPGVHAEHVDDLAAAVRAERADPHPGQHLAQTLLQRRDGVSLSLVRLEVLRAALAGLLGRQLEQQPRMHGRCADRHQHRKVVDVERVAGLDRDVGAGARGRPPPAPG